MSNNQRINGIEQIETALRTLEAYGYDTAPVWSEHNAWLKTMDTRKATEKDATWATRNAAPASIVQHCAANEFEILSAAGCFVDRQYQLSPGQRDTLRERHGLTPAKTIVVTHVALFPGSNIIFQFAIKSAEHIDVRRRKHVLVEAVITPAADFFEVSAARDKEREAEKEQEDAKRVKKGLEPISVRGKALQYFE